MPDQRMAVLSSIEGSSAALPHGPGQTDADNYFVIRPLLSMPGHPTYPSCAVSSICGTVCIPTALHSNHEEPRGSFTFMQSKANPRPQAELMRKAYRDMKARIHGWQLYMKIPNLCTPQTLNPYKPTPLAPRNPCHMLLTHKS